MAAGAAYVAHQASIKSLNHYLSHFSSEEHDEHEGLHEPKTHGFSLGDNEHAVPEAALIHVARAGLKTIRYKMETDIDNDSDGKGLFVGLTSGLRKNKTHCEIEAIFEITDGSEGVQIVQEKLYRHTRGEIKGEILNQSQENEDG